MSSNKAVSVWGNTGMSDFKVYGGVGKDGEDLNFKQLGIMWSEMVINLGQALCNPCLIGNKMFQKEGNCYQVVKSDLGCTASPLGYKQYKKEENGGDFFGGKGAENTYLDLSMGFFFEHVAQSLQQIHQTLIVGNTDVSTGYSGFAAKLNLEAKGKRVFQNLRFAKIDIPSTPSKMEVISAQYENYDGNREVEEIALSSSRKLYQDVNNSVTESTGLVLKSEHPEKNELLYQQASLKYTQSEVPDSITGSAHESFSAKVAAKDKEQTENVFKSALAGGFSCALSAFIMHPVDTVKTQVQASTTLSLPDIISKLPQIGVQGVYRGIVPAVVGQFSSHGLRTGICETIKFILVNVAPTMPDIQVESVSSFCGTILGTTTRIPSEVIKQRLQAGLYKNLGEAIIGTWKQDGLKAFFRGTGATLCREIPFYVAGMGLYTESKKVVQRVVGRQLEPWEIIVVGAVAGGLAAVTTTPFDVIKTRMMIATGGSPQSMSEIALSILKQEGPLGLYKGAVPRFFWVAPLGAMNFAGYELAREALG